MGFCFRHRRSQHGLRLASKRVSAGAGSARFVAEKRERGQLSVSPSSCEPALAAAVVEYPRHSAGSPCDSPGNLVRLCCAAKGELHQRDRQDDASRGRPGGLRLPAWTTRAIHHARRAMAARLAPTQARHQPGRGRDQSRLPASTRVPANPLKHGERASGKAESPVRRHLEPARGPTRTRLQDPNPEIPSA